MEAKLTKLDDSNLTEEDKVTLTNNAPMFLFDRAIYNMDGNEMESVRDPGRASLIKGVLGYSSNLSKQNTFGWILESTESTKYKIYKN